MRIAYVMLHLGRQLVEGGVGNKISTQCSLWRAGGHLVRRFLLSPDPLDLEDGDTYRFQPGVRLPLFKTLSREFSRSRALARLIQGVSAFEPDVIYLRYGLYAPPLVRLFSIAPLVLEINTNDVEEYRGRGWLFFLANRLTRGILLRRAAGLVAVSREIADYPFNRVFHKPMRVISNGIPLERYSPLPPPHNPSPRLVLVGTPGMSWHGADKVVGLARRCPDLAFDIVGFSPQDLPSPLTANVQAHGFLAPAEVRDVLSRADAVFGTLALHRKGMQEASPLKVREALAYGLPVVLAYTDTDLSDAGLPFLLQIPNTEDNLFTHQQQVRDFAFSMCGRRADRALVRERIDQGGKEQARLAFFEGFPKSK